MKKYKKSTAMTIKQYNEAFRIMCNALNEVTSELNKELSDCKLLGRIPCVYAIKSKNERIQFWSDAIEKLSNTKIKF
jgi:hypothetical protein